MHETKQKCFFNNYEETRSLACDNSICNKTMKNIRTLNCNFSWHWISLVNYLHLKNKTI